MHSKFFTGPTTFYRWEHTIKTISLTPFPSALISLPSSQSANPPSSSLLPTAAHPPASFSSHQAAQMLAHWSAVTQAAEFAPPVLLLRCPPQTSSEVLLNLLRCPPQGHPSPSTYMKKKLTPSLYRFTILLISFLMPLYFYSRDLFKLITVEILIYLRPSTFKFLSMDVVINIAIYIEYSSSKPCKFHFQRKYTL